jgi:hypothetical protein
VAPSRDSARARAPLNVIPFGPLTRVQGLIYQGCTAVRPPQDSMNQTNGQTAEERPSLAPPLHTAPDMTPRWADVELEFDAAADLIVEAHKTDGISVDLPIADLKTWAVAPLDGQFALVPLARHHAPKPLRSTAFTSLMTRIGAPADFIRRLPAALQLATVNYLLASHDETSSATLRLRGEEVAAIVSDRYAPIDVEELVTCVRDALVRFDLLQGVRVRGVASGMVDNLRLILPAESVAVRVGDISHVGLDISTSSFGRSAIHLSPVIWRLACLNGMRSSERRGQLSFRHVGDKDRLRAGIAEAIPSALAHARGLMTQWQRAVTHIVEDVAKQIEEMRELTNPEKKAFEEELKREAQRAALPEHTSLYSLVNALTALAKSAAPARRLELEGISGDMLQQHLGRA